MATRRSSVRTSAVNNLHRWNTVTDDGGKTYYLLTAPIRDIIEDFLVNGGDIEDQVELEMADGKNGTGTGQKRLVYLTDICHSLQSGQERVLPIEAF